MLTRRSLKVLNERLHTLGLDVRSDENLSRALANERPVSPIKSPQTTHGQQLGSGLQSHPIPTPDQSQYYRRLPHSHAELRPQDSISMYRQFRPPVAMPVGSSRRGGTNVDPGDESGRSSPAEDGDDFERGVDEGMSFAGVTMGTPRTGMESQEQMTAAPTSAWTAGTL